MIILWEVAHKNTEPNMLLPKSKGLTLAPFMAILWLNLETPFRFQFLVSDHGYSKIFYSPLVFPS